MSAKALQWEVSWHAPGAAGLCQQKGGWEVNSAVSQGGACKVLEAMVGVFIFFYLNCDQKSLKCFVLGS